MRCTATTRRGEPCRGNAIRGQDRCSAHRREPVDAAAVEQLLAMLRAGNYLEIALRATGLGLDELELVDPGELERARAEGEVRSVARVAAAAADNWQAAAWLLERQYPDRWARPPTRQDERPELPSTGPDGLDELAARRNARRSR